MTGGFTFNGIHSSTYGLAVVKISDSLMPPTRDSKEEVPGRDGAWDFGSDFEPRPISIEVALKSEARANLKATIRQVAGWLNPKAGQKHLVFDDEPDKYYLARLVGKIGVDQLISAFNQFSLTFVAYDDPLARGDAIAWEEVVDIGTFVINNPGTYETKPVITLFALDGGMPGDVEKTGSYDPDTVINDVITNPVVTLNGKTLQYTGTINPGGALIIDCSKLQATIGGLNALPALSGDFPVLGPGDNNLSVTDETSNGGVGIRLEYFGRWL